MATEYTWVGASNDWRNVESYTVGGKTATELPGLDDEILIPTGTHLYADDSTIGFFGTVGAIHMKFEDTLFTVTLQNDAEFGCPVGELTRDHYYTNHLFIKEGPGKLTFTGRQKAYTGGAYNLNVGIHIKEGEIDPGEIWGTSVNHVFKQLILEKGTTLHCMTNTAMWFNGIFGSGTIAAPAQTSKRVDFWIRPNPGESDTPGTFSGKITGKIDDFTAYGSTYFTGEESDFSAVHMRIYGYNDQKPNARCGFMKLGPGGAASSLGTSSQIQMVSGSAYFEYLGSGRESTGREFVFYSSANMPTVFDGGTLGSLVLTGAFSHSTTCVQHRVTFTGSNPNAVNVVSNTFSSISGTAIPKCSFFVRKTGSGTWRFADRWAQTHLSGVVGVDEGKLEFETIHNIGVQCSLGDATDLYEDKGAPVANMSKVPYAHFVGGSNSVAVFSYVGNGSAYVDNRPVAVTGKGRFEAPNCTAYSWKPFMGSGSGEKSMTFACAAHQTNTVSDVKDSSGGAEGTLSVVKDGPGDLVLSGNLAFGGDLIAKGGGTLTVRDIKNSSFQYYRLVIKETTAGSSLPEYTSMNLNAPSLVSLSEFGLYDANGTRVNTFNEANTNDSVSSLRPSYSAMENVDQITFNNSGTFHTGKLFDNSAGSGTRFDAKWSSGKYPRTDDPSTWMKAVVRLPANKAGAASFDLNYSFGTNLKGNFAWNPTAFSVEGSVDGLNWSELYATNNVVFLPTDYYFWLSSMTSPFTNTTASATWRLTPENVWHGRIPLSATMDTTAYSMLENVRSIGAAAGTRLVYEGSGRKTVAGIRFSKADGIGTIENFELAENGTLFVDGVENENSLTIPGDLSGVDGLGNTENWSLCVNGRPSARYTFSVTAQGVRLDRKGLVLMVR